VDECEPLAMGDVPDFRRDASAVEEEKDSGLNGRRIGAGLVAGAYTRPLFSSTCAGMSLRQSDANLRISQKVLTLS